MNMPVGGRAAAKFRVGDRVRATDDCPKGHTGRIHEAEEDDEDSAYLVEFDTWRDGHDGGEQFSDKRGWWLLQSQLEPAPVAEQQAGEPKFKVGDRVNVNGITGNPGTVTEVGDKIRVRWDGHFSGIMEHFRPSDLYLIRRPGGTSTPTPAIVARLDNGQPRPAARPFVHPDRASAETEAKRLAKANPGREFGVYEFVSSVSERHAHEWQRLAASGDIDGAAELLHALTGMHHSDARMAARRYA